MRRPSLAVAAALAALALATPASAGDLRVEGRAGLGWANGGSSHAVLGAAVGYDVALGALGTGVYGGVEQMIEAPTSGGNTRWGTSARIGAQLLGLGSVYAIAGYHYGSGPNATSLGAGYQQALGPVYGRLEYRHYFNEQNAPASNGLMLGLGLKF